MGKNLIQGFTIVGTVVRVEKQPHCALSCNIELSTAEGLHLSQLDIPALMKGKGSHCPTCGFPLPLTFMVAEEPDRTFGEMIEILKKISYRAMSFEELEYVRACPMRDVVQAAHRRATEKGWNMPDPHVNMPGLCSRLQTRGRSYIPMLRHWGTRSLYEIVRFSEDTLIPRAWQTPVVPLS
jgi:hypothetical protein